MAPTDVTAILSRPFFRPGGSACAPLYVPEDPGTPDVGSEFARSNRWWLLAGFVPALSLPVGANPVPRLDEEYEPDRNFNMQGGYQNGWPRVKPNWLHGDLYSVAYVHVGAVYRKVVEIGGLNEP